MKKKFQINPKTLVLEEVEYGLGYWLRQSGLYNQRNYFGYCIFISIPHILPLASRKAIAARERGIASPIIHTQPTSGSDAIGDG
jgi:hypothetical protein